MVRQAQRLLARRAGTGAGREEQQLARLQLLLLLAGLAAAALAQIGHGLAAAQQFLGGALLLASGAGRKSAAACPPALLLVTWRRQRTGLLGPLGLSVLAVLEAGHFELEFFQFVLTLIIADLSLASNVLSGISVVG